MDPQYKLIPVQTVITSFNDNISGWNQPFNKVSFINLDPTNPVSITSSGTAVIPVGQQLVIALNVGEVNVSDFTFDFGGSATGLLNVIFTRYLNAQSNQWKGK
jgi:hypothetical protein